MLQNIREHSHASQSYTLTWVDDDQDLYWSVSGPDKLQEMLCGADWRELAQVKHVQAYQGRI